MRFGAILVVLFVPFLVFSQIQIQAIRYQAPLQVSSAPLGLPFWDDFSSGKSIPDTLLWQYGADLFVNASLGINPPTYGVATLDGLTQFGAMHAPDNEFSGPTDSLVSHPIKLGSLPAVDQNTVYLSFYWQGKGNGEKPDHQDSLRLQFYEKDSLWTTVWVKTGDDILTDSSFTQEILKVDPGFLHDNFKMKFQAFGRQSGPFDTWHLDYIYLNKNRTPTDTLYQDRALSGIPSTPFSPFFEIPAGVFFFDPSQLTTQSFDAVNLSGESTPLNYYMSLKNLVTREDYGIFSLNDGGAGDLLPGERRTLLGDPAAGMSIPISTNPLDSQLLEITYHFQTGDKNLYEIDNNGDTLKSTIDLRVNDTIRTVYHLFNHFAYDDGEAEYAAGLNEKNGKLAIRFILPEPDTLTHIDIHFPTLVQEAVGNTINIMVWTRIFPSEQLRQVIPYTIEANKTLNEFKRIALNTPHYVKDTVFIGFQQVIQDYIPIGFDRNNQVAYREIFSKTGTQWARNERLRGAFMIRAVFNPASDFVLASENLPKSLYPNPTSGYVYFDQSYSQIEVFGLDGKLMKSDAGASISLGELQDGLYLIRLYNNGVVTNKKIVVSH